jgi:hypothetical protein
MLHRAPRDFEGKLIVLQQFDGFHADTLSQIDMPVDSAEVEVEGAD